MNKKEFIKALRSKMPFYAYVIITDDDGMYMKQLKNEWFDYLNNQPDDVEYDITITDGKIYLR